MGGKRLGTVGAVGLVVLALTGCSPSVSGILGVQKVGDDFRVLIATCDDFDPPPARVLDRSREGPDGAYLTIGEWPTENTVDGIPYAEVAGDELRDLLGDGEFMLWGQRDGLIPTVAYGPTFTDEDLNELIDGEILTVDPGTFQEVVVSDITALSSPPDLPACR